MLRILSLIPELYGQVHFLWVCTLSN
jgi:hypothetical protein